MKLSAKVVRNELRLLQLETNMGCPSTFQYRREELQRRTNHSVTDIEVLKSFLTETSPKFVIYKRRY
jgi:hypothetical protein